MLPQGKSECSLLKLQQDMKPVEKRSLSTFFHVHLACDDGYNTVAHKAILAPEKKLCLI